MLPTFLRGKVMIGFIQSLLSPVIRIHDSWTSRRSEQNYRLTHNGQVCYLRKVLNDAFDPTLRRIRIVDGSTYRRQYIYTSAEQQPKYLGKVYLRQSGDYADTGVNFRVLLPVGFDLNAVVHQMNSIIDYYKLVSKRYKIQYDE